MKGTTLTELMWIYAAERMSRKLKYVKSGRGKVDYNRKLHKPYRSERVLNRLMKLDAAVFFKTIESSQQEASNAGTNWVKVSERLPEMDTPVFAGWFWNGKFVWHVFMRSDSGFEDWIWSRSYSHFISDNDEFIEDYNYPITHWMYIKDLPMPEGE